MRSTKKLIISISMLVLCVCVLTFGIYAAITQREMNTNSSIGFNAKDCDVEVACVISGSVLVTDTSKEASCVPNQTLTYTQTKITDGTVWTVPSTLYFDEYSSSTIPPIVFSFTIYNNSDFTITATATMSQEWEAQIGENITETITNNNSIATKTSGKLTISIVPKSGASNVDITKAINLFNIKFERKA